MSTVLSSYWLDVLEGVCMYAPLQKVTEQRMKRADVFGADFKAQRCVAAPYHNDLSL